MMHLYLIDVEKSIATAINHCPSEVKYANHLYNESQFEYLQREAYSKQQKDSQGLLKLMRAKIELAKSQAFLEEGVQKEAKYKQLQEELRNILGLCAEYYHQTHQKGFDKGAMKKTYEVKKNKKISKL